MSVFSLFLGQFGCKIASWFDVVLGIRTFCERRVRLGIKHTVLVHQRDASLNGDKDYINFNS